LLSRCRRLLPLVMLVIAAMLIAVPSHFPHPPPLLATIIWSGGRVEVPWSHSSAPRESPTATCSCTTSR
jgi:hypothetical protein